MFLLRTVLSFLTLKSIGKHTQISEHDSLTKDSEAIPCTKLTAKPQITTFFLHSLITDRLC